MNKDIQYILNLIDGYLVGGCVRDYIMNLEPHDFDIASPHTPQELISIFDKYNIRWIPTGIQYGTITILYNNSEYEITTFRSDGNYSDGRRPDSVTFSTNIEDDLSRRDFSLNSIAMDKNKNIIDPFDGINDINNKIIRCVGNPNERFKEDALRMLRAIRFATRFNFDIENNTFEAILKNVHLLKNVSNERIKTEIEKTILVANSIVDIDRFKYLKIFEVIFPEITKMYNFKQNNPHHAYDVWEHTIRSVTYIENDPILKWTMIFHDIGKPNTYSIDDKGIGHFYDHQYESVKIAKKFMTEFKFSNKEINTISTLIEYHMLFHNNIGKKGLRKYIGKLGINNVYNLLKVFVADSKASFYSGNTYELETLQKKYKHYKEMIDEIINEKDPVRISDLAINGNDLKSLGFVGVEIGEALRFALNVVINDPNSNAKYNLIQILLKQFKIHNQKGWINE